MKQKISLIYEINTRVWLKELSAKYEMEVRLDNIPEGEISSIKKFGFDSVWLMGVWLWSKKSRYLALGNSYLIKELKTTFPELKPTDIICSPYSVAGYEIDSHNGDRQGILKFKTRLNKYGIKLILDFIPNHLALDHPWVKANPEFFINGTEESLMKSPDTFFAVDNSETIIAYGKELYFHPWTDVAQLNYFNPQTRKAMKETLLDIAPLCDGFRCDMAMLVLKDIQKKIWGQHVFNNNKFNEPELEFWAEVIPPIKKSYPEFVFIAEAYWETELELLSLGFDYVYDKDFYDALRYDNMKKIESTLTEKIDSGNHRLNFIENHDEDRAAVAFKGDKFKAATLLMMLVPGAHLFHQGQFEGYKIKQPMHLIRRVKEEVDVKVYSFYEEILPNLKTVLQNDKEWIPLEFYPINESDKSYERFIGIFNGQYLAIINYSDFSSRGYFNSQMLTADSSQTILKNIFNNNQVCLQNGFLDMPSYSFYFLKREN